MKESEGISQRIYMHNHVDTDNSVVIVRGKGKGAAGWQEGKGGWGHLQKCKQ